MPKLPGWAFMLVGAGISAYSKFVESRSDSNLTFFFWTGLAFVLYGLLREGTRFLHRPKKKEKPGPPPKTPQPDQAPHGRSHHESHQHTRQRTHHSHPHQPQYKICPRCHAHNRTDANYCHRCACNLHSL